MPHEPSAIALGRRIRSSASIRTVGVLPSWEDYPREVRDAIRSARMVFYPSPLYADVLRSMGKRIFPRSYYRFMGNKILQTQLFQLLEIAHPRTRLYYGHDRAAKIAAAFEFPMIGKSPLGSSKGLGVYLIQSEAALHAYLDAHRPAYIQEYLPIDRDLRVVVIDGEVIHAYWRVGRPGEFRCNVARGAHISFENIPKAGLDFALDVARRCGFDEVGMDVCFAHGRYWVLEANMVFGLEGFRQAGIDLYEHLARIAEERMRPEAPEDSLFGR